MYPLKIKEKYDQLNLNKLGHRFTVAYLWTYIDWDYRENVWSHTWVDIVPVTKWQEVLSCLDWKIFKAWEDWAYWKFVFIEHTWVPDPDDMNRTTTLYSCYEHLSQVNVKTWEIVKEWTIIWNTWNTWNSFWEHLHFQIDRMTAPFHAYWPYTWAEVKAAWTNFMWAANIWLGIEKGRMYTINPLVYLDKLEDFRKSKNIHINSNINKVNIEPINKPNIESINKVNIVEKVDSINVEKVEKLETIQKINLVTSNDNIIVKDPYLDILSSLSEDEKKNLI